MRIFSIALLLVAVQFAMLDLQAQQLSNVPQIQNWCTDGPVYSMASSGNLLYVGGKFDYVGPATGNGAKISTTSDKPDVRFPRVDGRVTSCLPDGIGGWYIGGSFKKVGQFARRGLAHILADGNVDPLWKPTADTFVSAIIFHKQHLIISGYFTRINGVTRNYIAALDKQTGALLPWNPNANGIVASVVSKGNVIVAGGTFSQIGGQIRNRLAELDDATALATGWNPNVSGFVIALHFYADKLYVGGNFDNLSGQVRTNIARFNSNGLLSNWNPNANGFVTVISGHKGRLFVGGSFNQIGGQTRNNLAAIDSSTALALPWNPDFGSIVNCLAAVGDSIYLGGDFRNVANVNRDRIAAVDANSGQLLNWNPSANGSVVCIAAFGKQLYLGGYFNSMGGKSRNNLAAIDLTTGEATAWNPNPIQVGFTDFDSITSIKLKSNRLYIGGRFNTVGQDARQNLASIRTDGTVTNWNPNVNGIIRAIEFHNNNVILGGNFSQLNNQTRNNIGSLDTINGNLNPWNPDINGEVNAIQVRGNTVYAGGVYSSVGSQTRLNLASINAITGSINSWTANVDGPVFSLLISGTIIYVGGLYQEISNVSRRNIAGVELSSGLPTSWNPISTSRVRALAKSGKSIFATGSFQSIGREFRYVVASLDSTSGNASVWNPYIEQGNNVSGFCLEVTGNQVWIGGKLPLVGSRIAKNNLCGFVINPTNPSISNSANASTICEGDSAILTASSGSSFLWFPNGETTPSIKVKSTGEYSVIVENPTGFFDEARQNISVNPVSPVSITANGPVNFCEKDSVRLTVTAGDAYLWIPSGQTTQFIYAKTAGLYSVFVTQPNGCKAHASQIITTKPVPSNVIDSTGPMVFCRGELRTICGPDSSGYTYKWSNGATTQCLDITQSGNYTLQTFLNGCASKIYTPVSVTVKPTPPRPVITASGPTTICPGESVVFSGPAGFEYLWSTGETTRTISVSSNAFITLNTILNGCYSQNSLPRSVILNPIPPTPTIIPNGPTSFCQGDSVKVVGPLISGYKYVWRNGNTVFTNDTLHLITIKQNAQLGLQVVQNRCTSAVSSIVPIIIKPTTQVLTQPVNDTICLNGTALFKVKPLGNNLAFEWFRNGSPIAGANDSIFKKNLVTVTDTGVYYVKVTGDCGSINSQAAFLKVPFLPRARLSFLPASQINCLGDTVVLSSANSSAQYGFQWYKNRNAIANATKSSLSVTESGTYSYRLTQLGCSSIFYDSSLIAFQNLKRPRKPVINIINPLTHCNDSVVLGTSSVNVNYKWFSPSGLSSLDTLSIFKSNETGNYLLSIDSLGCTSQSKPITISGPTSAFANPEIYTATVRALANDSVKCHIIWKRNLPVNPLINEVQILRQTDTTGIYNIIGTVGNGANDTLFVDNNSFPSSKPYFYKIRAKASCAAGGTYFTPPSSLHKTIHLQISNSPGSNFYNLFWSAYQGFNVSTYKIYRGTTPDAPNFLTNVAGNITSYTDAPPTNDIYYYRVESETSDSYNPWGRINATIRKAISNTRNTIQRIATDSSLIVPLRPFRKDSKLKLEVFPNPHQNKFYLQFSEAVGQIQLVIYDTQGKMLKSENFETQDKKIEVQSDDLPKGMYWLHVRGTNFFGSVKVLKD